MSQDNLFFYDYHPQPDDFYGEVLAGLQAKPKYIPAKFFYDETGSRLFEEITRLPEYYLTRTENEILNRYAPDIADCVGDNCVLVEPGSGNNSKVRILLEQLKPSAYVPMEISKDHMQASAKELAADYDWLPVHAACADFTQPLALPMQQVEEKIVAFFPGSTIGNFEPEAAVDLMHNFAHMVGPNGGLVIGVDLKKDRELLQAAYDDSRGVTAQFNRNLLIRMNRELTANFQLENFQHQARYNPQIGRMESYLESRIGQDVVIGDTTVSFRENECIHTENSYKYDVEEFQDLAQTAGFKPRRVWRDEQGLFSVHYMECA